MVRWMMVGMRAAVALALCLGGVTTAGGQATCAVGAPCFRVARTFGLSGSSESAFPVQFVLADVGSVSGPPDGIQDIVAVQQNQRGTLLYGRADGAFPSSKQFDLNEIPTAMAVGDFDGDALLDLVVCGAGTVKTLSWFRGTGDPAMPFSPATAPLRLDGSPVAAATVDINGDEKLDVIVLNDDGAGGTVQVLLGQGDGTFEKFGEPFAAGSGVSAVAVAELTGDSHLDVAVASAVNNSVRILGNPNGNGFLVPAGDVLGVGLEPVSMAIGDLNQDGLADIVTANRSSDSISVLLATAPGEFASAADFPSGAIGSYPSGVAVGDFNRDGNADIFVANNRSSDVAVLIGDGAGGFPQLRAYIVGQEPAGVLAADLNGDGSAEAISLNFGSVTPNVAVVLTRENGAVNGIQNIATPFGLTSVQCGDVDGDGRCDLIVGHDSSGPGADGFIEIYRSPSADGTPQIVDNLVIAQPAAIASGDTNGDGVLDIVAINEDPASLVLFTGRQIGGFDNPRVFAAEGGGSALVVGDWNGDGLDDIAAASVVPAQPPLSEPTGRVEIRLATPSGLGTPTTVNVTAHAVSIASGDFNGDGRLDLFVASGSSVGSALLLGNGAGGFVSSGAPLASINNAQTVVVADYDRDQHDDIAIISAGSDRKVIVSFGDGTGAFPTRRDAGTFNGPSGLAARDVTADGIADLLVTDQASNEVTVLRSRGAMRQFNLSNYGVSRQPTGVTAGDFDGDGRYDIAAVTTFVSSIAVLSNDSMDSVVRGDGNNDSVVSAADAIALASDLADGGVRRIEDVDRGAFAGSPGLDANGDGSADRLDTLALVHRLFNEL